MFTTNAGMTTKIARRAGVVCASISLLSSTLPRAQAEESLKDLTPTGSHQSVESGSYGLDSYRYLNSLEGIDAGRKLSELAQSERGLHSKLKTLMSPDEKSEILREIFDGRMETLQALGDISGVVISSITHPGLKFAGYDHIDVSNLKEDDKVRVFDSLSSWIFAISNTPVEQAISTSSVPQPAARLHRLESAVEGYKDFLKRSELHIARSDRDITEPVLTLKIDGREVFSGLEPGAYLLAVRDGRLALSIFVAADYGDKPERVASRLSSLAASCAPMGDTLLIAFAGVSDDFEHRMNRYGVIDYLNLNEDEVTGMKTHPSARGSGAFVGVRFPRPNDLLERDLLKRYPIPEGAYGKYLSMSDGALESLVQGNSSK